MEKVKLINDEKGVRLYIDGEKVYPSKSSKILTLEDYGVKKNKKGEYCINKQIIVDKGEKLIIKPGTHIKVNDSIRTNGLLEGSIAVDGGVIEAIGTKKEPIVFISSNNKECGNAIELRYSDNSIFKHCEFYYMIGLKQELDRWKDIFDLDDRVKQSLYGAGLYCYRSDNLIVEDCKFYGCTSKDDSNIFLLNCKDEKIDENSACKITREKY